MFFLDSEHVGMREMPPPPPPKKKTIFIGEGGGGGAGRGEGGKQIQRGKSFSSKMCPSNGTFCIVGKCS